MMLVRTLACSLALLAVANVARASVIFFTDRTSFENAVTVSQTVDFESSFNSPVTSITFGDATFVSTIGNLVDGGVYRTADGSFGGTTTRLAAQNFGGIRIDLASGHFAIGMDVGELIGSSSGQFSLMSSSDTPLDLRTTTIGFFGDSPTFVGWISSDEIGSLEFTALGQSEQFEAIDNVTLGQVDATSNIPAPATLYLFALGLAGVRAVRRMRAT